jgi:hypothetical protein
MRSYYHCHTVLGCDRRIKARSSRDVSGANRNGLIHLPITEHTVRAMTHAGLPSSHGERVLRIAESTLQVFVGVLELEERS